MPDRAMLTGAARPVVLLIHGVAPDRRWLSMAKRILEPHFRCAVIDYGDYDLRRGGAVKAVVQPLLFLVAVAAVVWGVWRGPAVWLIAAGIGAFACAAAIAAFQRRRCASRVKAQISTKSAGAFSVHAIAHSFGTYLVASAMETFDIDLDRVVLVGSVLPRRLDWERIIRAKPADHEIDSVAAVATEIRNEVGRQDHVVWMAGLTGPWSRLGRSGRRGFRDSDSVHTTPGPWDPCGVCVAGRPVRVHNVPLDKYGHSDHFLGPGHVMKLWLPYLWGYTPREFDSWIKACGFAAMYLQDRNEQRAQVLIQILKDRRWTWTRDPAGGERSLAAHIEALMLFELERRELPLPEAAELSRLVDEVMTVVVNTVHASAAAAYESQATIDDKVRWRLDPNLAVRYSVGDLLDESR